MSLVFADIATQRKALASRTISASELARSYLDRIARFDSDLGSFITVAEESAMAAAAEADRRLARGDASPLCGIPIAHKDIFCTNGIRTSCASRMLANFIAPYDAHVVSLAHAAGTVMVGKTNMDEFAMGSSGESSYFGATANPFDLSRVPGGSSSGSAAAVAAGLISAATGSDTGGSIRQPAAFCGVTGVKPTYGRVSRYGMIAFASSLDCAGVIARSAADAALLLGSIAGFDARDSTSVDVPVPDYTTALDNDIRGWRIGLPAEYLSDLDPAAGAMLDEVRRVLEQAGAEFIDVSLRHSRWAIPAYYVIAPAEASANLSRYDGVRFGHRCESPRDLFDLYRRSRSEGFGIEVKRRIMTGTYALSVGYFDAYYLKAQRVRRLIRQDFLDAFGAVDLLLTPTTPGVAFKAGALRDDPVDMYRQDIHTIGASLAGLPGLSMPAGEAGGLPLGAQLLAPHFAEERLFAVAAAFQRATDWHLRRPEAYA